MAKKVGELLEVNEMKEKYGLSESAKNNLVKHKSELEDIFT
jgi:hypothetical protein